MKWTVNDPDSGTTLTLEGDSPPTESELTDIFSTYSKQRTALTPTSTLKEFPGEVFGRSEEGQQRDAELAAAAQKVAIEGPDALHKKLQDIHQRYKAFQEAVSTPEAAALVENRKAQELRDIGVESVGLDEPVSLPKLTKPEQETLFGTGRVGAAAGAAQRAVTGIAEGFVSPEGMGMFAPKIGPIIGKAFMAQMIKSVPEQVGQATGFYSAGDKQSGDEALINAAVTAGMLVVPHALAKRPNTLEDAFGKENAQSIRDAIEQAQQPRVPSTAGIPLETPPIYFPRVTGGRKVRLPEPIPTVPKGEPNAVQEQKPDAEVLRQQESQLGLPQVGQGNAQPQTSAATPPQAGTAGEVAALTPEIKAAIKRRAEVLAEIDELQPAISIEEAERQGHPELAGQVPFSREPRVEALRNELYELNAVIPPEIVPEVTLHPETIRAFDEGARRRKKREAEQIETPTVTEPLPDWVREAMVRAGLDPKRPLNDIDIQNPSVREAIQSDPTLTPEQKAQLLKTGSPNATPQPETPSTEATVRLRPAADSAETETILAGQTPRQVPSSQIALRPSLMQFKEIEDASTGENQKEKLSGKWDPYKSGNLLLWEPTDPKQYGLTGDQRYIVANGHHRVAFGERQNVPEYSAQVLRESDGYSAQDARRQAAEINIADGKGTIYDQVKYLRNSEPARGANEEMGTRARLGSRGRQAAAIAFDASDDLYSAFLNERITPEQASAVASAAPKNASLQAVGLKSALAKRPADEIPGIIQLAKDRAESRNVVGQQGDLFSFDDSAIRAMEEISALAQKEIRGLRENLRTVSGAAARPETAATHGVDVKNPVGLAQKIVEMRARIDELERHPEKAQGVKPELTLAEPETVEQQKARLAQEQAVAEQRRQAEELAKKAAKPLAGTTGDLGQGDLLNAPQDLFAPPKPELQKPFGSQNKLVTPDQAAILRKRIQDKFKGTSGNVGMLGTGHLAKVDPQLFSDSVQLGAFYIEGGYHKFVDWSAKMLEDFGDAIKDHLNSIYETAKIAIESPSSQSSVGRSPGLQPGLRHPAERIVTARQEFTKPADESIIPQELIQHLDPHQRQGAASALASLLKRGAFLLSDGTGAGKTRQAIAVAHNYAKLGKKVLIITKSETIKQDWKKNTFGGSYAFDSNAMGIKIRLARDGRVSDGEIGITTYQNLASVEKAADKNTVLIFDESHALKNDSQQAKFGMRAVAKSDKVMFMSATPADKPEHIYYLAPIGVMEGKTTQQQLRDLGMTLVTVDKMVKEGDKWVKRKVTFWAEDQRVSDAERHERFSALFDRLTGQGAVLKREISMDGVHVQVLRLSLPPEAHETMGEILHFFDAGSIDDLQGLKKAVVLGHQRRQQEPYKIAPTVMLTKRELDAGRQVVIFVSRVNTSEVGKWETAVGIGGERERFRTVLMSSEGTTKSLRDALHEAGIHDIAEIHGNADQPSLDAMRDFQEGRKRVVIATIESGGTGINLDDTIGNRPRSMVVVTAPFDAVGNVQAAGRIWRLKTLSGSSVFYLFGDTDVDQWNADIIGTKMSMLGAVVEGQVRRLNMSDPELVGTDDFHSQVRASQPEKIAAPTEVPALDWKPFKTKAGQDKFVASATQDFWDWYNANGKGSNPLGLRPSKWEGQWNVWADKIPPSEPSGGEAAPRANIKQTGNEGANEQSPNKQDSGTATVESDLHSSGKVLWGTSDEIERAYSASNRTVPAPSSPEEIRQAMWRRLRSGPQEPGQAVPAGTRIFIEKSPTDQRVPHLTNSDIFAHRILFGPDNLEAQNLLGPARFVKELADKLSLKFVFVNRADDVQAFYNSERDAVVINSRLLDSKQLDSKLLESMDAVLSEELIHAVDFRVNTKAEREAVWRSLSPEEQASTRKAYDPEGATPNLSSHELGAEYLRLIVQERLLGKVTELTERAPSFTAQVKKALQNILTFLRKTFGAKPENNIARQLVQRIEDAINGGDIPDRPIDWTGDSIASGIMEAGKEREKRRQTMGVPNLGAVYTPEKIVDIQGAVRQHGFDGTQAVSTVADEAFWQTWDAFSDPATRRDTAIELQAKVGLTLDAQTANMAPGLQMVELQNYALQKAAAGDPIMARWIVNHSNEFLTNTGGGGGDTGQSLRSLGETSDLWKRLRHLAEKRAQLAGERLGVGPELFEQMMAELDNAKLTPEDLGPMPDIDSVIPEPDVVSTERRTKKAEQGISKTADKMVAEAWGKYGHGGPDWSSTPQLEAALAAMKQYLVGERENIAPQAEIDGLAKRLEKIGVTHSAAENLAYNLFPKRNLLDASRIKSLTDAEKRPTVRSLIESLLMTPIRAQSDPRWVKDTATNWFLDAGLSRDAATEAAGKFVQSFRRALTEAQYRIADRFATQHPEIKNMPDLRAALRAHLLDPSIEWPDSLAQKVGFKPLSSDDFSKLADLELKAADPSLSPPEFAAYNEQMMTILRHSGKPDKVYVQRLAEGFVNSLLSGIRTLTIQLEPVIMQIRDYPINALRDPKNAINFLRAIKDGWTKVFKSEAQYGWQKKAWGYHLNEIDRQHDSLKTWWENLEKEYASAPMTPAGLARKASVRARQLYASQQYVSRLLNTIDQSMMASIRESKLIYYAADAFRLAGLSTSKVGDLVDAVAMGRQSEYEKAIGQGLDPVTAKMRANYNIRQLVHSFVSGEAESALGTLQAHELANKVLEAEEKDLYSMVGRRAKGVTERDEGMLSQPMNILMEFISKTRAEGGIPSMLSTVMFGFVNIPFRTTRYWSQFSPYGLLRYGIHKYRTDRGLDTFWKQSMGNELQARQQLRVAIAGTVTLGLASAWAAYHHTSDDKAGSEDLGLYITGSGPSGRVMQDAFTKAGWKPYSLMLIIGGHKVAIPVTRVGEAIMFPFIFAAAADDAQWKMKELKAAGKQLPDPVSNYVGTLIGTSFYMTGQRGLFQGATQISSAMGGASGPAALTKAIAKVGGQVVSASVLPFKQMLASLSDMFIGPMDSSSASSIVANAFPIVGLPWQNKALNRFGDPMYDRTWYGRIARTGIPIAFQVSKNPENERLYDGLLLQKGVSPPDLRRGDVERRYGPMTNDQFAAFVRISGQNLKSTTIANLPGLLSMPSEAVDKWFNGAAKSANDQAEAKLALERVKPLAVRDSGSAPASTGRGFAGDAGISLATGGTRGVSGLGRVSGAPRASSGLKPASLRVRRVRLPRGGFVKGHLRGRLKGKTGRIGRRVRLGRKIRV